MHMADALLSPTVGGAMWAGDTRDNCLLCKKIKGENG